MLDPFWCYCLVVGVMLLVTLSFTVALCGNDCAGGRGGQVTMTTDTKKTAQKSPNKQQQPKSAIGERDKPEPPIPKLAIAEQGKGKSNKLLAPRSTLSKVKSKQPSKIKSVAGKQKSQLKLVASKQKTQLKLVTDSKQKSQLKMASAKSLGKTETKTNSFSLSSMYKATVESVGRLFRSNSNEKQTKGLKVGSSISNLKHVSASKGSPSVKTSSKSTQCKMAPSSGGKSRQITSSHSGSKKSPSKKSPSQKSVVQEYKTQQFVTGQSSIYEPHK